MNVHIFTTGRGTPYGLAMAPVIKVASQTSLAKHWHDLIDVDAGSIASGEASIEDVGWEIFQLILDVASGRHQTFADKWRLFNDLAPFNPAPLTEEDRRSNAAAFLKCWRAASAWPRNSSAAARLW